MDHVYKSQLQTYTMKQNMELPVYAAEREGPPHSPLFRCKVTVCGQTFQGQDFCPTLKAAEHAAAKVALASLTSSNPEGVDVAYKNLLQEIAQKENSLLPVYATASSGPSHSPTFISTVEFDGKAFKGEEAKTKKLAEWSAAKVAFMSIKYGHHPNQTSSPSLPCEQQEAANSNVKSSVQETPSTPSKMATPDVPSKWIEVYEDELPEVLSAPANNTEKIDIYPSFVPETPTNNGNVNAPATNATKMNAVVSSPIPQNNPTAPPPKAIEGNNVVAAPASVSLPLPQNPTNDGCGETLSSVEETEQQKLIMGTGHLRIQTGQHVVCRPWNPEMTLPQDVEMLFRDDRFIAYRLVKP